MVLMVSSNNWIFEGLIIIIPKESSLPTKFSIQQLMGIIKTRDCFKNLSDIYQRISLNPTTKMNQLKSMTSSCAYNTARLDKNLLLDIDMDLYPPKRVHFLANALQMQVKLPSEQSMFRSELRNQRRNKHLKADTVTGRPRIALVRPRRRGFRVPDRYGPQPIVYPRSANRRDRYGQRRRGRDRDRGSYRPQRQQRGFSQNMPPMCMMPHQNMPLMGMMPPQNMPPMGMMPPQNMPLMGMMPPQNMPPVNMPMVPNPKVPSGFAITNLVGPTIVTSSQIPTAQMKPPVVMREEERSAQRKSRKFPQELTRKPKQLQNHKVQSDAVNIHSPEWITFKSERVIYQKDIEQYRKESKKEKLPQLAERLVKEIPEYFRKKKASQKRRRLEKHELIKKNRKALVEIFGNAIFQSGWPISRQEIKKALGLDVESQKVQELGDFMKQVEQTDKDEEIKVEKEEVQIEKEDKKVEKEEEKPVPFDSLDTQ